MVGIGNISQEQRRLQQQAAKEASAISLEEHNLQKRAEMRRVLNQLSQDLDGKAVELVEGPEIIVEGNPKSDEQARLVLDATQKIIQLLAESKQPSEEE